MPVGTPPPAPRPDALPIGPNAAAAAPLARDQWCPTVYAGLARLLARDDLGGRCAAFDWDNTCLDGDVGDAALRWQLDHLHLALPPHRLVAQWQVPVDALAASGSDAQLAQALLDDVADAARTLWPTVAGNGRARARHTPAHLDLRAKLCALADLLSSAAGGPAAAPVVGAAYRAVAEMWGGLDAGLPARCVAALCAAANDNASENAVQVWHAASAGRTGPVHHAFRPRLRAFGEMRALMAALGARGVRVVVVSASFQPLVQSLAYAWGMPLAQRDVFGFRLAPARFPEPYQPRRFAPSLRRGYPVPFRAGKVACLAAHRLEAPVLVAGDAPTDLEMLTHWPQTRVRLVLHRSRAAPEMAALYREAEEDRPCTLLQGRNERTGVLWPRAESGVDASS